VWSANVGDRESVRDHVLAETSCEERPACAQPSVVRCCTGHQLEYDLADDALEFALGCLGSSILGWAFRMEQLGAVVIGQPDRHASNAHGVAVDHCR